MPASIQTHNTEAPVQQIEGAGVESPIDLRYFRAGAVLKIDSVYRPDIGRLVTQLEYAGMKSVHYHNCQIPAGQYFFSMQLRPTSFQIGARPRVTANVDVLKLRVSGGRDPRHSNPGLKLIATKQPTLTNAFLKRDWRSVVDIDPGKYVGAPDTNTNKLYARMLEVGLAKFIGYVELNETEKARVLFQNLSQDKAFFYTWHDAYPKLSRPVRKLLAEMFFSRVTRVDLPNFHANFESAKLSFRSPRLSSDRRRNQFEGWGPDFEALDLLHEHFSGTAIASSENFRENRLRYYVELGDFESGLAFAQGLTLSTPQFYELQGVIYYNNFDYQKASQFWKRTGKQDYQLPPQLLMKRYFAEYVLLRETREGLTEVAGGQ